MSDHHYFAITDPGTVTIVTGAFATVIDRKTGRILKTVPEMPILEKYGTALAGGVALLRNTEGVKGVEELRLQVAKFLASIAETLTTEVTAKSS